MSEKSSLRNNDLDEGSESVEKSENDVYSEVLTKLRSLQDKSEKKEYHTNILNDGAKYMAELIVIIEEHKGNIMNKETASSIKNWLPTFSEALNKINMDELFENDSTAAYETFYLYIYLLNVTGMKNYFQRQTMQNFIKLVYEDFAIVALSVIRDVLHYCILTVADLKEPLDNQELFLLMLNFMKDELDADSSSAYSTITVLILAFLWQYSDKTVVVPTLIKVGYPKALLKWLTITDRQHDASVSFVVVDRSSLVNKSKSNPVRPSICIILNISRHDDGINVLNSLGANNAVKKLQNYIEDSEMKIVCCMTLALLSTPEQIKNDRKHMNNALDQLLQTVSHASLSKSYTDIDDFFHISEPLVVLVKLFNDDRALDYILQHAQVELDAPSTLEFFINLLLNFNENVESDKDYLKQLTCTALVNILWSVSFQEDYQYRRQLKTNQDLMKLLEIFSNSDQLNENAANSKQYVPKYIESIQTASKGILLNINEKSLTDNMENHSASTPPLKGETDADAVVLKPSVVNNNNNCGKKPMIMISYSHDDKVLCYQLEEELKRSEQFDIWIDKDYCAAGDSWEHIARGIKQSQVILCLITANYTSKSVRREVIYAIDRLEKPLVPVFLLKPDLPEWLDIRTCDLTYVRFTDEKQLEQPKISKLIETLHKLISKSTSGSGSAPAHYEPVITVVQTSNEKTKEDRDKLPTDTCTPRNVSQKSIDQWNKADIKQWWQDNGIILELYDLCQFNDGSELLSYAKLLLEDEKTQYKSYADEFPKVYGGKTLLLHQFNKFSNALRKLVNEPHQRTSTAKPKKSSTCQIL